MLDPIEGVRVVGEAGKAAVRRRRERSGGINEGVCHRLPGNVAKATDAGGGRTLSWEELEEWYAEVRAAASAEDGFALIQQWTPKVHGPRLAVPST